MKTTLIAVVAGAACVAGAQEVELSLLGVGSDLSEPLAAAIEINGGRDQQMGAAATDTRFGQTRDNALDLADIATSRTRFLPRIQSSPT